MGPDSLLRYLSIEESLQLQRFLSGKYPQGHGFMAPTSMNSAGYVRLDLVLETVIVWSSKGCLNISRVSFLNNGKEYCRKGTFDFKATSGRKYWREQKMNGPEGCTDYVDIYFEKWKD